MAACETLNVHVHCRQRHVVAVFGMRPPHKVANEGADRRDRRQV
jgi:hypothetical protein